MQIRNIALIYWKMILTQKRYLYYLIPMVVCTYLIIGYNSAENVEILKQIYFYNSFLLTSLITIDVIAIDQRIQLQTFFQKYSTNPKVLMQSCYLITSVMVLFIFLIYGLVSLFLNLNLIGIFQVLIESLFMGWFTSTMILIIELLFEKSQILKIIIRNLLLLVILLMLIKLIG